MALSVGTRVISEIADLLTEKLLREDLKRLITEDGVWETFVEAAGFSSEEQAVLHDLLKEHVTQKPILEMEWLKTEMQKYKFLLEFPDLKRKLEEHIKKIRELADHLDLVHKDCTISNVVTSFAGILSALGLAFAPTTGGASLLVSEAASGLGAAAGVTGLTTTVVEESVRVSDEAKARSLVGASKNIVEEIFKLLPKFAFKSINTGVDLVSAWKILGQRIRAFRVARASSRSELQLADLRNFAEDSEQVGNALSDSALPMTRRARIRAVGFNIILFGLDFYHLVTDLKDLSKGATTKSGGALRDVAHKLEEKLQQFEQIHKALQSGRPQ